MRGRWREVLPWLVATLLFVVAVIDPRSAVAGFAWGTMGAVAFCSLCGWRPR